MINFFRRVRLKLDNLGMFRMDDVSYLRLKYLAMMGKQLDLESPRTFNEKLQWLKLYDRKPEYTKMVDKYEVKKYVAEKIGEQYIIPTIGVYDRFEDINFDELPSQFVIKCTHDSGGLVICNDKAKLNIKEAKKKINNSLKKNYFWSGREWPYKNVKPRVLVEKMLPELDGDVIDYKFMCFDGKVRLIFTCSERRSKDGLKVTWFTPDWKQLDFTRHYPSSKKKIDKPKNLNLMIKIAEELSRGIPFVRIDLYNIDGKIYFGEYTFYPGTGLEEFEPEEWDEKIGEMLVLPQEKDDEK